MSSIKIMRKKQVMVHKLFKFKVYTYQRGRYYMLKVAFLIKGTTNL